MRNLWCGHQTISAATDLPPQECRNCFFDEAYMGSNCWQLQEDCRRSSVCGGKRLGMRCRPCRRPNSRTTPVPLPVFCACGVQKHPGPFGGNGFHLGDVTKPRFLRGFGLQEGARGGTNCILRSFQHRWPKHGPNIAPKMAQHGPT